MCHNILLRNYQKEIESCLFDNWEHKQNILVQMPTGTGKTHLLASVIYDHLEEEQ